MAPHVFLTTYEREQGSRSWKEVMMSDRRRTERRLDLGRLRLAIEEEYAAVARDPGRGYHFHTGRPLASMLGYRDDWLEGVPEGAIASFAGTGNPFRLGQLEPGERVVDVGSGAGMDSLIAATMVGPDGRVIGVDMTRAMLDVARTSASEAGLGNVEFREGLAESLPVPDSWADVVISNGVLNLLPDKLAALQEIARVLKPAGRLQVGDILVQKAVPEAAKQQIDLWTG
jgi:SAM-dependent methyltransferase